MKSTTTILKRELRAYFATPVAYVFIVIFLLLTGILTFYMGGFFEREQADLAPFFFFHPWLYLILVPAISMRLWAEERKTGTIELLLALPFSTGHGDGNHFTAADLQQTHVVLWVGLDTEAFPPILLLQGV